MTDMVRPATTVVEGQEGNMSTQKVLNLIVLKTSEPVGRWPAELRSEGLGFGAVSDGVAIVTAIDDPVRNRVVVAVKVEIDADAENPTRSATEKVVDHLERAGVVVEVDDQWGVGVRENDSPLTEEAPQDFSPRWTSAPGETLREILQEQDRSVEEFARASGIRPRVVMGILAGLTPVVGMVAESIAKATGTSTALWTNLENAYAQGLGAERRADGVAPREAPDLRSAWSTGQVGRQWLSFADYQLRQRIQDPTTPGMVDHATVREAIDLGSALVSLSANLDRGSWSAW